MLPASRSYGPFSATEVSAALNTAQQLLVAGNLNPQTLSGGSPAISSLQGGPAGGRCDVNDGFVHPAFPGGPAENVKPNGPTIDPYDQRTPPPPPADAVQPRAPDRGVGDL